MKITQPFTFAAVGDIIIRRPVGEGGCRLVQVGPNAMTMAAIPNEQMGLSQEHTRQVLSYGFGLEVRLRKVFTRR